MQSIEDDIKLINEVWGSEDALRSFLQIEVERLCPIVCGRNSSVPETDIRPTILARGIPGFSSGLRSAEYEPREGDRPATIVLFPSAFTDKEIPKSALTHELIHHWEISNTFSDTIFDYPIETESVIQSAFKDPIKLKRWRTAHSPRFVSKAISVAQTLNIPILSMLVHR